jgi:hypothetical protein
VIRGWVLAAVAIVWLVVNKQVEEGPVLVRLTDDHGLVAADLVGLAGLVFAGALIWRDLRSKR